MCTTGKLQDQDERFLGGNGIHSYEHLVMGLTRDLRGASGQTGAGNENHYQAVGRWEGKKSKQGYS